MKRYDVFLSHDGEDVPWVVNLKAGLQALDIRVWLAQDEIRPGDIYAKSKERAIAECRAVALIISPAAISSGWVEAEYYRALNLATRKELQLIPVLYKQAPLPGFLSDRYSVNFSDDGDFSKQLQSLVWGIPGRKPDLTFSGMKEVDDKLLLSQIRSGLRIVELQLSLFASVSEFYDDQYNLIANQLKDLDHVVENIQSNIPAGYYSAVASVTSLQSHIRSHRDHLASLRDGDANQRGLMIDQLKAIHRLLSTINSNLDTP